MIDLATEKEHLARADRNIAEGEKRIARQGDLVEELRQRGQRFAEAEALLGVLRQTLQTWLDPREEILRTIARLEGRGSGLAADPAPGS